MAQPQTQDNQKVFQSATQDFQSFAGSVDNTSSSKNMEVIYANMSKLFDLFTQGALKGQGANSEIILRTVYRGLDEDFVKILQDSDAVEKIGEKIQEHQQEQQEGSDIGSQAEDLQTGNNSMKLILDFLDELRSATLSARTSATREYESEKYNKIDETRGEKGTDWTNSHLDRLKSMLDTFKNLDGKDGVSSQLKELQKIVSQQQKAPQENEPSQRQQMQTPEPVQNNQFNQKEERQTPRKNTKLDNKAAGMSKGGKGGKEDELINPNQIIQNAVNGQMSKNGSKIKVKPSADGMCICPICGGQHSAQKHGAVAFKQQGEARKMTTPSVMQNPLGNKQSQAKGDSNNDISTERVAENLNIIHGSISNYINSKKFKNCFLLKYPQLQKGIQKQMKALDEDEEGTNDYVKKTEKGIKDIKDSKKKGGNFILGILTGGIVWTVLGAIILATLARAAIRKWTKAYMPKPDGSKLTVFGIEIPGWDFIKALGLGVKNFLQFGLMNQFDRLSVFVKKINKSLFGKDGIIKSGARIRNVMRKVIGAWLISQSKKLVGGIAKIILMTIMAAANIVLPGSGLIIMLIVEVIKLIYTFIVNQVLQAWSNSVERDEERMEKASAAQTANTQKGMQKLRGQLAGLARGIQTFKNQMDNIPGLQTPKDWKAGSANKVKMRSAIMSNVRYTIKTTASKEGRKLQTKTMEDQEKQSEEQVLNNWKKAKSGSKNLMSRTKQDAESYTAEVSQYLKSLGAVNTYQRQEMLLRHQRKINEIKYKHFSKSIVAEIAKLDAYQNILSQSHRFPERVAMIYDPTTGWNAAYRIFQKDLLSPIPFKPFEEIHTKSDISIGREAGGDPEDGYEPFKWIDQNGSPVNIHPIKYELGRARAIRHIYEHVLKALTDNIALGKAGIPDDEMKQVGKWWNTWNFPLVADKYKDFGDFDSPKPKEVYFQDLFARWLKKWKAGKKSYSENNLENVLDQVRDADHWYDRCLTGWMDAETVDNIIDFGHQVADVAIKPVADLYCAMERAIDYDLHKDDEDAEELVQEEYEYETEEERQKEESGWSLGRWFSRIVKWVVSVIKKAWRWVKKKLDKAARAARAMARVMEMCTWDIAGMNYGKLRTMMFDRGVIALFNNSKIANTENTANQILEYCMANLGMPRGPGEIASSPIGSLMYHYYNWAGIKGFNLRLTTPESRAGFAQLFLEYFGLKIMPKWREVEGLVAQDVTFRTEETEQKLKEGIYELHSLFKYFKIFPFIKDYLRFPNMITRVVDYVNANSDREVKLLDRYRVEMGYLTPGQKEDMLRSLKPIWNAIPTMSDTELLSKMDYIRGLLTGAMQEAHLTGDTLYQSQLQKYWDTMNKEKKSRLAAQRAEGQKKGNKITYQIGSAPKTLYEMEQQRQAEERERKRREAELARKKAIEDEKRLKEEAERRKRIAKIEAEKKAMEAIRKQEENYERILEQLIKDPASVKEADLKSLGREVEMVKREAESKIAHLPRDEMEVKLALIRGDKLSPKTFKELRDTASGLGKNLNDFMKEVRQIPVGTIMNIQQSPVDGSVRIPEAEPDNIDMGDE